MKRQKETDFTTWSHKREVFESESGKTITVDTLSKSGSHISFSSNKKTLTVTGNFGNWIFNHSANPYPDRDACIDNDIWCKRITSNSAQQPLEFSLWKSIQQLYLIAAAQTNEKDYIGWLTYADAVADAANEVGYKVLIEECRPDWMDIDAVEPVYVPHKNLLKVFDAFEAVCLKLYEAENLQNPT